MSTTSPILDASGKPMQRRDVANREVEFARNKALNATYDGARPVEDMARYWTNADRFDADSSHSKDVRHTLISRSRYEVANNGYSDGIAQTYATDLVGTGPNLRMQTGSKPFNQLVERNWQQWTKAVKFRRKLWCMAHAKHVDGEAFGVIRRNDRIRPVPLDVKLYEAEQCQTPFVPYGDPNYIDGIHFDDFDEPEWYDFLRYHPGAGNALMMSDADKVPASMVLHWYKLRRPGQHRGVPECASTLNLGASFRRLREANLSTSEKVAAWTFFLKTLFQPDELDRVPPMDTMDILHGMMTALPNSVEPFQLKAEHPGPTYDTFHKTLLNEQARPKSMPYNKAACDSSDYNYASGRLDHQTYYGHLDVDRADCDDLVLDRVFEVWFDLNIRFFGWLGGEPEGIGYQARAHVWDWPKHRVADVKVEAEANETKLQSGQTFLHQLYSDAGYDFEDELSQAATTYGVDVDELRTRLLDVILPPPKQLEAPTKEPGDAVAALLHRANGFTKPTVNGNGVHHAN